MPRPGGGTELEEDPSMASAHQEPTPAAGAAESREIIVGPAILFTPANRRDFIPKAAARADMVILDLEDGAGRADREEARANIAASGLDPKTTIVRVGGPQLDAFAADCEFVRQTPFTTVMVPKLRGEIPPELAGHGLSIIAQIETPEAVLAAGALAKHPDVVGMFWGAEDLVHLLGGTHSRLQPDEPGAGRYRDQIRLARSMVHMQAAAAGKFLIDAVHADFHDEEGMYREALDAARSGIAASACIHPAQVAAVRKAYRPEPQQLDWAQRVVARSEEFPGAFQLDGEMVDAPIISQARRILGRAKAAEAVGQ